MKSKLIISVITIISISLIIYFIPWIINNNYFEKNIYFERDTYNFNLVQKIKNDINIYNVDFYWLKDFNVKFQKDYFPAKKCMYLKSINNWNWVIISFILESDEYIEKFWNKEYLFISDSNYIISDEENLLINKTINNFCEY